MGRKIQKSLEFSAKLKGTDWQLKFNTKDCDLLEVGNLFIGQLKKICEENNADYIDLIELLINGEPKPPINGEVKQITEVN